jgi:hypothetical protein
MEWTRFLAALVLILSTFSGVGADDGESSDTLTAAQSPMGIVMAGRVLADTDVAARATASGVIGDWRKQVKVAAKAAMDEVRQEAITSDPFRRPGTPLVTGVLNSGSCRVLTFTLFPRG